MCTRHSFCASGMRLSIIPDSSVRAMKAGDGHEVIYIQALFIVHLLFLSFTGLCRC